MPSFSTMITLFFLSGALASPIKSTTDEYQYGFLQTSEGCWLHDPESNERKFRRLKPEEAKQYGIRSDGSRACPAPDSRAAKNPKLWQMIAWAYDPKTNALAPARQLLQTKTQKMSESNVLTRVKTLDNLAVLPYKASSEQKFTIEIQPDHPITGKSNGKMNIKNGADCVTAFNNPAYPGEFFDMHPCEKAEWSTQYKALQGFDWLVTQPLERAQKGSELNKQIPLKNP